MSINTLPQAKSSGLSKNFLFTVAGIIVFLGVAFAIWRYYNSSASTTEAVLKTTDNESSGATTGVSLPEGAGEAARRITRELDIIRTLRPLDTAFFEDARFGILKQTPIVIPKANPVEREFSLSK